MHRFSARLDREHGQMLLVAALMITVLLAFAGLILDAGFAYAQRRQAQNAADQAALAAARVLLEGGSPSAAVSAAREYADANGYDNLSGNTVTIAHPPSSASEHAGDPNFIEVIVEEQPETYFIQLVIPGGATVRARAVAGFQMEPQPYALVVLDEDDCEAFEQGGNADLVINGGSIMVNSDCPDDAISKGGNGDLLVDGTIDVHGGYEISGPGTVSPEPRTVGWTMSDPLASLTPPPLGAPAPGSPGTAEDPETWRATGNCDITLSPGTYYGGFDGGGNCTVTLQPGIYIMAGGGFTKRGNADFLGDGVMIYVTTNPTDPTGDGAPASFDIAGNGVLDLNPISNPSDPHHGITLWQDAAVTDDVKMRGNTDLLAGVVYAPGATLNISGNSDFETIQLVVNGFYLSGNASIDMTYGEYRTFEAPDVGLVE